MTSDRFRTLELQNEQEKRMDFDRFCNETVTTIITGPKKANTSSGNWCVWVRDSRADGSIVDYSHQFMRKREAQQWIDESGFDIRIEEKA